MPPLQAAAVPDEPGAAGCGRGGEGGWGPGRQPGSRASHLLTESAVEQQSKSPSEFLSGAYPASPRGTPRRGGGGQLGGEEAASEAAGQVGVPVLHGGLENERRDHVGPPQRCRGEEPRPGHSGIRESVDAAPPAVPRVPRQPSQRLCDRTPSGIY
ncbi:uncharacterized protein LOC122708149 isoform X2 [Cervus elaphus]|uniref:uncharacterized protein LOC122708149 isoform X2 n=1 Tax=Cervus elaphus TaxID=9860 RepID=UPI001CC27A5B|nr:uncharacterized protein LOC122708149 isoform X2 [Cervus elaphus]